MTRLRFKPYIDEAPTWPDRGRVILAQYDTELVVVYEALSRAAARSVVQGGRLDALVEDFDRMHWFGTSFTWFMRRTGWATERGQRAVLALWLRRDRFDEILREAVPTHFTEGAFASREAWQEALDSSDVRAQWAPDFPPHGPKLNRKALEIGLRGEMLRGYVTGWVLAVEDITSFVRQQAQFVEMPELLFVPAQDIYPVRDEQVAARLNLTKRVPD